MAKMIQKIQGGADESIIFQCYCGEDSYFNISRMEWNNDVDYHAYITKKSRFLKARIKYAWEALQGRHTATSAYVMLSPEQVKDLIKELTEHSSKDK